MEDVDVRMIFTRLLETEPHTPDLVPYVNKARHDTRRRRWAVAGAGAATGAIMVAAVLVVPTVVADSMSDPASTRPATGSAVAADPQQAHAARLTETLRESEAQWLPDGGTLKERVAGWPAGSTARPGAGDGSWEMTFAYTPTKSAWYKYPSLTTDDKDELAELERAPFDGVSYGAGALVTNSGHVSKLSVSVSAVIADRAGCPPENVRADACVESPTADGGTLVVVDAPGAGAAEWKLREVRLIRPDGTMAIVGEYTATEGPSGIPSDGEYALTIDQLKKIALLPGLVYKYQS